MPTALPTELVKEIQDLLIREVDRGIVSVRGRVFLRMTAHQRRRRRRRSLRRRMES